MGVTIHVHVHACKLLLSLAMGQLTLGTPNIIKQTFIITGPAVIISYPGDLLGQKCLESIVHCYGLLKGVAVHVVISVPFDAKWNLSNCTWDWNCMGFYVEPTQLGQVC